ncbi:MAG: hypothetical protein ACRD3D_01160 [Terriglobia bacterium]
MSESILYNGTVRLSFDESGHRYKVSEATLVNGETVWSEQRAVPSITTILKVIDKSGPLIWWALGCAGDYLKANLKPGSSLDEIQISSLLQGARMAHRHVSREACDVGTLAHAWIEDYLAGVPPALPVNEQARNACLAAQTWIGKSHYKVESTETRLYSRKYEYAGTCDAQGIVATVCGRLSVVDWKTSKAIYPEYRFQTAAYAQAASEMTDREIRDRWIVRIGKDGVLEELHLPVRELRADLEAFLAAKTLYDRLFELGIIK